MPYSLLSQPFENKKSNLLQSVFVRRGVYAQCRYSLCSGEYAAHVEKTINGGYANNGYLLPYFFPHTSNHPHNMRDSFISKIIFQGMPVIFKSLLNFRFSNFITILSFCLFSPYLWLLKCNLVNQVSW